MDHRNVAKSNLNYLSEQTVRVNKENGAAYKIYKMKGKGKTPTFEPLPYIFYCQAQGPLSTPGLSYTQQQFPQYENII